jgi:hypothetical protein
MITAVAGVIVKFTAGHHRGEEEIPKFGRNNECRAICGNLSSLAED